jgi:chromosome segregation protein
LSDRSTAARARLTALRLVGFKSFAERTTVEFGAGISAVVGPNGSGKSNLADALRWTLGEQGRLLRTRRAEDVIFAGSSLRRAIGMADVTLVLDNSDRLLPVDFEEVEISRRLYRSGENDYLLNRQRVRLRDLTELLDAGNLADNAFLFIGQGMVDQALALRPEERRPLFEEAAGVRRHERRRRRAEAELGEAAANLERVDDLLGELRPQARRLSAQAEQLRARRTAGLELAEGLVAAARTRWHEGASAAARQQQRVDTARGEADAALVELRAAEESAESLSRGLAERAESERDIRGRLEEQRAMTVELRLGEARLGSELTSIGRERERVETELAAAGKRLAEARRLLAAPRHTADGALRAELGRLDEEIAQLGAAKTGSAAPAFDLAARRRAALAERQAATAHGAEAANLGQRLEQERATLGESEQQQQRAQAELRAAGELEESRQQESDAARGVLDAARTRLAAATSAAAAVEGELAAARARLGVFEAGIAEEADDGLLRAARARGARLVAEGLEIEPGLRRAVEAALGDALRALAIDSANALALRERQGTLLLTDRRPPRAGADLVAVEAARTTAAAGGGGLLVDAIRRDPAGDVTGLLSHCVWLPTLEAALALGPDLPAGWRAVTAGGEQLDPNGLLRLAPSTSVLDQRAARDEQAANVGRLGPQATARRRDVEDATAGQAAAAAAADAARVAADEARRARRLAEEHERAATRRAEAVGRELDWLQAQVEAVSARAESASAAAAAIEAEVGAISADGANAGAKGADDRSAALQARRADVAARVAADEGRLQAADDIRRRAEVGLAIDSGRSHELEETLSQLAARIAELRLERERTQAELAAAEEVQRGIQASLDELLAAGSHDRTSLLAAEQRAIEVRERLRAAETASRSAEVAAVEARLQLEQVREGLLVELAGIGTDALTALGQGATDTVDGGKDEEGSLEDLLAAALPEWSASPPPEPTPAAGRLASLRRRFHDLGAGNPFAAEEYEELRQRLDELEAQRADLTAAMVTTRQLIANLGTLINEQFRSTFTALEDAFGRRFEQLFGGGEAQLSLTTPDDLSTTGIEITARPPGKKRQPLGMLSGGERALTAVCLLLAMLEVRPVPFCVLDEVDAALDEANIGRFSAALRSLADRIQFIVITHNRGTIEAADALYGVTLGDDAVSRVVSMRLPPADGNGRAAAPADGETTGELTAAKAG